MNAEFALILEDEGPLLFRSLNDRGVELFEEKPILRTAVRALSDIYRGEKVNECTAVSVAKDLERMLKTMAPKVAITAKAMRYRTKEVGTVYDPRTQRMMTLVEQELVEIVA